MFFSCRSNERIFSLSCVTATTLSVTELISLAVSRLIDVEVTGAVDTTDDVPELADVETIDVVGAGKNVPLLVLINDFT